MQEIFSFDSEISYVWGLADYIINWYSDLRSLYFRNFFSLGGVLLGQYILRHEFVPLAVVV